MASPAAPATDRDAASAPSEAPTSSPDLDPVHTAAGLPARRFTAEEYAAMVEAGILGEEDKVELINGIIAFMSPQGTPHHRSVQFVGSALRKVVAGRDDYYVVTQLPLRLGCDFVPEPDAALIQGDERRDAGHETPDQVELIVEVAESSLERDRGAKLRCYAEAGIADYWIVNLPDQVVEVYRDPDADTYRTKTTHDPGADVPLLANESWTLSVDAMMDAG